MEKQVFSIMNGHHINALIIILAISIIIPLLMRKKSSEQIFLAAKIFGIILLFNEFTKPFYRNMIFGEAWNMVLPLHMCHLSAIMTGIVLITRNSNLFGIVYFWAFGGATMALLTPDLAFSFPDAQFIMFFITHGFIILGALYATIALQYRPTWGSLWNSFKYSLMIMVIIFPLNYSLGGDTNYLYLRFKPQVGSVMDFMPDPPFHIPFVIVLGLIIFVISYLPYMVKDLINKKRAA